MAAKGTGKGRTPKILSNDDQNIDSEEKESEGTVGAVAVAENPNPDNESKSDQEKREARRNQWGEQFHRWLIGKNMRKEKVRLHLVQGLFNSDEHVVTALPRRVDENFIQIELEDGNLVWIGFDYIISCS